MMTGDHPFAAQASWRSHRVRAIANVANTVNLLVAAILVDFRMIWFSWYVVAT